MEEEVELKGGKHAEASHCQVGEEGRRRRYWNIAFLGCAMPAIPMAHKMLPTKKMHKIEFVNHAKEQSISDSEVTQSKSEYLRMYTCATKVDLVGFTNHNEAICLN